MFTDLARSMDLSRKHACTWIIMTMACKERGWGVGGGASMHPKQGRRLNSASCLLDLVKSTESMIRCKPGPGLGCHTHSIVCMADFYSWQLCKCRMYE